MLRKNYDNFVRPSSPCDSINSRTTIITGRAPLSGDEARQIYLNEIKHTKEKPLSKRDKAKEQTSQRERRIERVEIPDKELFISVQNDDVDILKQALDACPDNVNKLDDYGWSLLMIACQANSTESVKELLKRGVDTSVRDKAGNSAKSLLFNNKNYKLADILLSNKSPIKDKINTKKKADNSDAIDNPYFCELCNIQASKKEYHLSSTIHNINISKGKKIPSNYVIPESNRGYQIMLKVGWDKESGLGPDGSGKKYPIKSVQKQDRKGLGHSKNVPQIERETEAVKSKLTPQRGENVWEHSLTRHDSCQNDVVTSLFAVKIHNNGIDFKTLLNIKKSVV